MKKIDDNEILTDEMLEAYLDNIDAETPDLWSKIELGFDKEVHKKKSKWLRYAGLAAAVLVCVCLSRLVPAVMNNKEKNMNKEDIIYSEDFQEETDSLNEGVCMSNEAMANISDENITLLVSVKYKNGEEYTDKCIVVDKIISGEMNEIEFDAGDEITFYNEGDFDEVCKNLDISEDKQYTIVVRDVSVSDSAGYVCYFVALE